MYLAGSSAPGVLPLFQDWRYGLGSNGLSEPLHWVIGRTNPHLDGKFGGFFGTASPGFTFDITHPELTVLTTDIGPGCDGGRQGCLKTRELYIPFKIVEKTQESIETDQTGRSETYYKRNIPDISTVSNNEGFRRCGAVELTRSWLALFISSCHH